MRVALGLRAQVRRDLGDPDGARADVRAALRAPRSRGEAEGELAALHKVARDLGVDLDRP